MSKIDITSIFKNLSKNELINVISIAQEILSDLFSHDEIKDSVKESRFSKGYECPKCQCKDFNKMENLVVDKDIYVSVAVQLLMK